MSQIAETKESKVRIIRKEEKEEDGVSIQTEYLKDNVEEEVIPPESDVEELVDKGEIADKEHATDRDT